MPPAYTREEVHQAACDIIAACAIKITVANKIKNATAPGTTGAAPYYTVTPSYEHDMLQSFIDAGAFEEYDQMMASGVIDV